MQKNMDVPITDHSTIWPTTKNGVTKCSAHSVMRGKLTIHLEIIAASIWSYTKSARRNLTTILDQALS